MQPEMVWQTGWCQNKVDDDGLQKKREADILRSVLAQVFPKYWDHRVANSKIKMWDRLEQTLSFLNLQETTNSNSQRIDCVVYTFAWYVWLVCSGHLQDTACKNAFLLLFYTVCIIFVDGERERNFFSRVKTSPGKSEIFFKFFFLLFHEENFPQPSFFPQGIFAKDSILLDFWQSTPLLPN